MKMVYDKSECILKKGFYIKRHLAIYHIRRFSELSFS